MDVKVYISFLIIKINGDDEIILVLELFDHLIHKVHCQAKMMDDKFKAEVCMRGCILEGGEAFTCLKFWKQYNLFQFPPYILKSINN